MNQEGDYQTRRERKVGKILSGITDFLREDDYPAGAIKVRVPITGNRPASGALVVKLEHHEVNPSPYFEFGQEI